MPAIGIHPDRGGCLVRPSPVLCNLGPEAGQTDRYPPPAASVPTLLCGWRLYSLGLDIEQTGQRGSPGTRSLTVAFFFCYFLVIDITSNISLSGCHVLVFPSGTVCKCTMKPDILGLSAVGWHVMIDSLWEQVSVFETLECC